MSNIGTVGTIPGLASSVLIVGLSALIPWRPAPAQTASGSSPEVSAIALQEIVVTARKRSENLQQVPIAVTAIKGDTLKEQSITTISNLQNIAPGLYIQQALDADPSAIVVTMRGRKQDDATMAVDASVNISVDGIDIPRTIGLSGAMLDIDRVEVLRGPQGTLYGRNSTGGAIGIFTNDPTNQSFASIDVTGGNYGTWNVLGIANIPITDDLAARFVAQRGGNGGYQFTTSGTPLGESGNEYFRGKLKWIGSRDWQAVLSTHYEHDTSGGARVSVGTLNPANFQGQGLPEGGYLTQELVLQEGGNINDPADIAQAVALEKSWIEQRSPWYILDNTHGPAVTGDVQRWDVGLNVSGDITDHMQLRSITGIQNLQQNLVGGPKSAVFIYKQHPQASGTYYSQEVQVLGKVPTLNWVVGAYGGYETGRDAQTFYLLPLVFGTQATDNDNGIVNTTRAAYAQATWEFVPQWHLTAGVRDTTDTREVDASAFNVDLYDLTLHQCVVPAPGVETANPSDPTTTECPRVFKVSYTRPTWLASIDRQITSNVLLYAKVATGYRSGGLNADGGAYETETFGAFAPETNIEYETGFKSTLFERRARLNVSTYWDDYSNLQVANNIVAADGAFLTLESNAATARIRGVETEGDLIVGKGLSLHASSAYTDAHYLKYLNLNQVTGLLTDESHEPFSVPKWTYTLDANYVHPTVGGDASIQLDYSWRSAVNLAPTSPFPSTVTQGAYGLLNARANIHVDAWNMDISIFGQNLTNKFYFDNGADIGSPGFDISFLFVGGAPRTVGAELVKKFGSQ